MLLTLIYPPGSQHDQKLTGGQQGVFTSLVENLGVQGIQFEELISLDPDTIRSLGYIPSIPFKPRTFS
jgi:hypothetical protein